MKKQFIFKDRFYRYDGYMTLEVALIFPVIFSMVILMLYLGFFVYDRCLLENSAYIASLQASRMIKMDNIELYKKTEEISDELIEGRLFAVSNISRDIEITFDHISIAYEVTIQPPAGSLLIKILDKNPFKISIKREAARVRPVTTIRTFRKLEKL